MACERSCFVMMPFDKKFDPVFAQVIKPAIEACGLACIRADRIDIPGEIPTQIRAGINNAILCLADLTSLNVNVVYEVALAHAAGKPVILITQDRPELLPFDLRHFRMFCYTMTDHATTRNTLQATVSNVLEAPESRTRCLEEMLLPKSFGYRGGPFVVATSPLTWREAAKVGGGFKTLRHTCSDHVGIRGLIQAFGLIYGLDRLPDLLNPGDYADEVAERTAMHLYCIGSPKANRWTALLLRDFYRQWAPRLEFKADPGSADLRNIRIMIQKDGIPYQPHTFGPADNDPFKHDFGLVIRGPHPASQEHILMVLAGRSSLGTEAACRAATDPAYIQEIRSRLRHERVDLNDHRKAFWAVVSLRRNDDPEGTYEAIPDSFDVVEVHAFRHA